MKQYPRIRTLTLDPYRKHFFFFSPLSCFGRHRILSLPRTIVLYSQPACCQFVWSRSFLLIPIPTPRTRNTLAFWHILNVLNEALCAPAPVTALSFNMASSATGMANGHDHNDHVLRPRPRKPQHSQVSQVFRMSSASDGDGHLSATLGDGSTASGMTRCVC